MVRHVQLRSLAKINLDLRVLHKRSDGFHELRTVFQTISLADSIKIEFESAKRTELILDDPLAIPDNLVLRAARAALDAMKTHARVRFRLKKNIPMGGGLGGGSSNAAAILLALPALAGRKLELETLIALGSELGSDVPFFLTGGTALGIGRGTELYPLPDIARESLIVVCPGVHSSTATSYQSLQRGLAITDSSSFPIYVRELVSRRSAAKSAGFSANDFELAVIGQHPELKSVSGKLRKLGAACAQMTGSGSAFFGVFESRAQRDQALETLRRGRGAYPAVAAEIVTERQYQALWRRQLA
ncbi:MAG: 4-(cytidine 5'-diphospho)-2-C-methyl-D-erythritol kinase [Acidobacteriota bacterium]